MSDKLFEYKDPQDWYIAQWGEDADYNQFSQVPAEASTLLDQLELLFAKDPEGFPLNLSVMRYGSAFRFLTFLTEILNEVKGRSFEIVQRQGALLLVEKGKLLYLHLPSDGVDLEAFLGQDKVPKIRFSLRLEMREKPKNSVICLKSWALKWKISINTQSFQKSKKQG